MKSLRFLLALALAGLCSATLLRATDDKAKSAEKTCDCPKDKDGKVCGKDKDCCCTGEKCDKDAAKEAPADKESKK